VNFQVISAKYALGQASLQSEAAAMCSADAICTQVGLRITFYYMATITLRLPDDLDATCNDAARPRESQRATSSARHCAATCT